MNAQVKSDWYKFWLHGLQVLLASINAFVMHNTGKPGLAILWISVACIAFVLMFTCRSLRFWIGVLFQSFKGEA